MLQWAEGESQAAPQMGCARVRQVIERPGECIPQAVTSVGSGVDAEVTVRVLHLVDSWHCLALSVVTAIQMIG